MKPLNSKGNLQVAFSFYPRPTGAHLLQEVFISAGVSLFNRSSKRIIGNSSITLQGLR